MFGNWYSKNLDCLKEFFDVNDLTQNFTCNYYIHTTKNEVNIDCEALIIFDSRNYDVEIIVSANIDTTLFPISFRLKQNKLDVEYGVLFLYGNLQNIGKYKAEITPYENI